MLISVYFEGRCNKNLMAQLRDFYDDKDSLFTVFSKFYNEYADILNKRFINDNLYFLYFNNRTISLEKIQFYIHYLEADDRYWKNIANCLNSHTYDSFIGILSSRLKTTTYKSIDELIAKEFVNLTYDSIISICNDYIAKRNENEEKKFDRFVEEHSIAYQLARQVSVLKRQNNIIIQTQSAIHTLSAAVVLSHLHF